MVAERRAGPAKKGIVPVWLGLVACGVGIDGCDLRGVGPSGPSRRRRRARPGMNQLPRGLHPRSLRGMPFGRAWRSGPRERDAALRAVDRGTRTECRCSRFDSIPPHRFNSELRRRRRALLMLGRVEPSPTRIVPSRPSTCGGGHLLRLQPVARVAIAGWLDPTAPALRRLGPVEDARSALSRAPAAQGPRKVGQCGYLQPKGPWRLSFSEALHRAFTKARFRRLGLISMEKLESA